MPGLVLVAMAIVFPSPLRLTTLPVPETSISSPILLQFDPINS